LINISKENLKKSDFSVRILRSTVLYKTTFKLIIREKTRKRGNGGIPNFRYMTSLQILKFETRNNFAASILPWRDDLYHWGC